jgi:Bifunctional DNA primase/polymerase, N-terminal
MHTDASCAVLLEAALACAARGWHVFPVRPGDKRPAFPDHKAADCTGTDLRCRAGHQGWEPRATTDPGRIRRAWAHAPYNVGIATGPSGLVVIDLDTPKPGEVPPPQWAQPGITDGADVLAALCEEHGKPFPCETFMVRTRRGGLHLYFAAPPGVRLGNTSGHSARGLGWLIDTRGHGGYVVAPGSFVDLPDGTGRYEVVYDRPPVSLPGWLAALLGTASGEPPRVECPRPPGMVADLTSYADAALGGEVKRVVTSPDHGHNWALNKAAFNLGRRIAAGVLDRDLAETALQAAGEVAHTSETPDRIRAVIRAGIDAGIRKAAGAAA